MDYQNARDSRVSPFGFLSKANANPGLVFAVIILTALLAFELFNYSTTDFALRDLLGDLKFAGIRWATILSIAFCGIDFAGIARLFTPEQGSEEPKEVWYLFGAWLLAATMNAILTWWGVSMAVVTHTVQSTAVMESGTLTKIVPVFVALMVWVIRILIIGSLSMASERLFWGHKQPSVARHRSSPAVSARPVTPTLTAAPPPPRPAAARSMGSQNRRSEPSYPYPSEPVNPRPEPTYHTIGMSGRPSSRPNSTNDSNRNNGNSGGSSSRRF